MTGRRLLLVVLAALFVSAAPAWGQDWGYGDGYDYGSGDPQYQDPWGDGTSQDWPSDGQDPSTDQSDSSDGQNTSSDGQDPSSDNQSQTDQGQLWNPQAGDPQENPSDWQQGWEGSQWDSPTGSPWTGPGRQRNGRGGNGRNNYPRWPQVPPLIVAKGPTVPGKTAEIRRNGLAAIPKGAPARVRAIIAAANQIIGKPYKWGGGHGRLFDSGYDCSGSVSYALIRSGNLGYPMVSGSLAHWGGKGVGKYVTIYANKAHVYMEVAGLRLDTSPVGDPRGKSGVRWRPPIGKRFGFAVRHVRGL